MLESHQRVKTFINQVTLPAIRAERRRRHILQSMTFDAADAIRDLQCEAGYYFRDPRHLYQALGVPDSRAHTDSPTPSDLASQGDALLDIAHALINISVGDQEEFQRRRSTFGLRVRNTEYRRLATSMNLPGAERKARNQERMRYGAHRWGDRFESFWAAVYHDTSFEVMAESFLKFLRRNCPVQWPHSLTTDRTVITSRLTQSKQLFSAALDGHDRLVHLGVSLSKFLVSRAIIRERRNGATSSNKRKKALSSQDWASEALTCPRVEQFLELPSQARTYNKQARVDIFRALLSAIYLKHGLARVEAFHKGLVASVTLPRKKTAPAEKERPQAPRRRVRKPRLKRPDRRNPARLVS